MHEAPAPGPAPLLPAVRLNLAVCGIPTGPASAAHHPICGYYVPQGGVREAGGYRQRPTAGPPAFDVGRAARYTPISGPL